jgi:hypothetical protein
LTMKSKVDLQEAELNYMRQLLSKWRGSDRARLVKKIEFFEI